MGSSCVYEEKRVIHELTQGLQLAEQLRFNLHSPGTREILIRKILSSYETALFVLKLGNSAGQPSAPILTVPSRPESSISFGSPVSEELEFDQPFSKKRKRSTTSENQIRICSGNELEGDTDDGHNWRKYGKKDISGSKYPRSYYRCSYRTVQKCSATKQVQRTDENPKMFEITYNGKHTCSHGVHSASPPPTPPSPEKHEITPTHHRQLSPPNPDEMLLNLRTNLSVDTSNLGGDISFSFPSTSSGIMEDLNQFQFPNRDGDELWQVISPFISPATSESNIFTEWGSSSSLEFLAGPADADPDFEFINSFF